MSRFIYALIVETEGPLDAVSGALWKACSDVLEQGEERLVIKMTTMVERDGVRGEPTVVFQ